MPLTLLKAIKPPVLLKCHDEKNHVDVFKQIYQRVTFSLVGFHVPGRC